MLAVDDDFLQPARISPEDDTVHGAWVTLVEPGSIPDVQRVALTLRRR